MFFFWGGGGILTLAQSFFRQASAIMPEMMALIQLARNFVCVLSAFSIYSEVYMYFLHHADVTASSKFCLGSSFVNEWVITVMNHGNGRFKSSGAPVPNGTCNAGGNTLIVPVMPALENKTGILNFMFTPTDDQENISLTICYGE